MQCKHRYSTQLESSPICSNVEDSENTCASELWKVLCTMGTNFKGA